MTKFNRKIFIPLLIAALVGLFWHFGKEPEKKTLENGRHELFLEAARRLNQVWQKGFTESPLHCERFFSENPAPKEWVRCNPHALLCLYEKTPLKIQGEDVHVIFPKEVGTDYKIIHKSEGKSATDSNYALEVVLNWKGQEETLWLEDQCSSVVLPGRVFGMGPFKKKNDFRWDSFSKKIYIDRHQVTNRDVLEWLQQTKNARANGYSKKYPVARWYESAGELKLEEMQQYCAFRGKQLLEARYLDAASFFIDAADPVVPAVVFRGPYPWTKKSKGTFVDQFKNDPDKLPNRDQCLKIPASSCKELLSKRDRYNSAVTWLGIFQVLGGMPEALRNPLYPKRNIRISADFLPMGSHWHEIGKRIYWDGQGNARGRFSWGFRGPGVDVLPETIPVAFRCMREEER